MEQCECKIVLKTSEGAELIFPHKLSSNPPLMRLRPQPRSHVGLTESQVHRLISSKDIEHTHTLIDDNHKLSKQQKELLLWPQRLGHAGLCWIQSLMRKPKHKVGSDELDPVIPTEIGNTHNCDSPACPACRLSEAHRKSL